MSSGLAAIPANDHAAETFAGSLPQRISKQHLLQLLSHLPDGHPDKAYAEEFGVGTFTVGAFYHCGTIGITSNTHRFPKTTSAICRYVAQVLHDHAFTTVVLMYGAYKAHNKDGHSYPSTNSLLVVLTASRGSVL